MSEKKEKGWRVGNGWIQELVSRDEVVLYID